MIFILVDYAANILMIFSESKTIINISSNPWWGLEDHLDKSYEWLNQSSENLTPLWWWHLSKHDSSCFYHWGVCNLHTDDIFTVLCLYISMCLQPQWGKCRTQCPWIIFQWTNLENASQIESILKLFQKIKLSHSQFVLWK